MGESVRVGIDVGGTNTDAVAIDDTGVVVARVKEPTTADPTDGIVAALHAVAADRTVDRVALGTTHAVNAIVQRRGLRRVALLRLGAPGTLAVPPCTGWPADLVAAILGRVLVARGGVEVDGRAHPLVPEEIRRFAASLGTDVDAIAITGTFSPLDAAQEIEAAAIVAAETGLPISLGHRIGGLGLLERENANLLNAALGDVIERVIDGLEAAVAALGPNVQAFLTQNDGTLMAPGLARDAPILTIGSGPSNSLRGAAALTGRTDVLVADVGGTSTDVGALARGFPRESAAGVTVGGVRTNFRMPDLVSVPVGGGTTIVEGRLTQASVARRIRQEALVFGGSTATLTDAAVAAGRVPIGDVVRVAGRDDLEPALRAADALVADAIDRLRLVQRRGRPRRRRRRQRAVARGDPRRAFAGPPRARRRRQRGRRRARAGGRRGRADRRCRRRSPCRRDRTVSRRGEGARGRRGRRRRERSKRSGSRRRRSPTWIDRCRGSAPRSPAPLRTAPCSRLRASGSNGLHGGR